MKRFVQIILLLTPWIQTYGQCSLTIDAVQLTDATCFGNCNGLVTVSASGNTGSIAYTWYDANGNDLNNNNDSLQNVCTGDYTVELIDGNNCIVDTTITVSSNSQISISSTRTNTTCSGNTGEIVASATGGCGGSFQYSIDGGALQTSGTFSNLSVGFYTILAQDTCGCTVTSLEYISATDGPTVASLNYIEPLCNGSNNGSITVFAFGANPIQYSIDGGVNFTNSNAFTNLSPGVYPVVIQDGGGCQSLGVVEMSEPDLIVPIVNTINETCVLNDGEISFSQSGGVSPFQYSIDNGITFQSSTSFTGLVGGNYDYVVEDNNGCSANGTVSLTTGAGPTNQTSLVLVPTCSNVCNGSIQLTAVGNNSPFTYTINGNSNPDGNFQGLCVGVQDIIIADANNCQTTFSTTLTAPSAPIAAFTLSDSTGVAPMEITFTNSSIGASSYSWLFGDSSASDTAMSPVYSYADSGTYVVTLIAMNGGCYDSAFASITVLGEPGITMPNVFTPNGDGVNDQFRPIGIGLAEMKMTIYNRWGEVVSEVWGIHSYWDGRTFPAGQTCPDGTYFYVLKAVDVNGNAIEKTGTMQLLR